MKTSMYDEPDPAECGDPLAEPATVTKVEILHSDRFGVRDADRWPDRASPSKPDDHWKDSQASLVDSEISVHRESWRDIVSPTVEADEAKPERWKDSQASLASSEVSAQREAAGLEERWSDTLASPPSSDASAAREARELWSDCLSPPETEVTSDSAAPREPSEIYYTASSDVSLLSDTEVQDKEDKGAKKECVIAGHVAAMRERFESMTRANTPCPDLARSASPSLDVFRNITPSPDRLG